jgi:hypothetical protein
VHCYVYLGSNGVLSLSLFFRQSVCLSVCLLIITAHSPPSIQTAIPQSIAGVSQHTYLRRYLPSPSTPTPTSIPTTSHHITFGRGKVSSSSTSTRSLTHSPPTNLPGYQGTQEAVTQQSQPKSSTKSHNQGTNTHQHQPGTEPEPERHNP